MSLHHFRKYKRMDSLYSRCKPTEERCSSSELSALMPQPGTVPNYQSTSSVSDLPVPAPPPRRALPLSPQRLDGPSARPFRPPVQAGPSGKQASPSPQPASTSTTSPSRQPAQP
ncbi:serine/arginine repetitive matrix protein 1-like [Dermacentor silvarum]|uniref:serine/arginine repetitive matrix protein 1-like n=1 Tax=Dermacentor silvarum TaxID=543639 RepID=UPI001897CAA5|nr:serine/arginine repetitive matrix protein 1-like [Dermacentor silvarum]